MKQSSELIIMLRNSFEKAIAAVIIFILFGVFQTNNFVREAVEDKGLDPVMKILSGVQQQGGSLDQIKVVVFAYDNDYMRKHGLYDKDDVYTAGYSFPRDHIARFFGDLDAELQKLSQRVGIDVCPKAVFIDFDTTFPSAGVDTPLSLGDKALIEQLATPKCYKVLLARTSKYNFIEKEAAKDAALQAQFDNQNILFVSPSFHKGEDEVIRRNQPVREIDGVLYPSVGLAMWQIDKTGSVDLKQAKQFINHVQIQEKGSKQTSSEERNNVNANWIWFKHYRGFGKLSAPTCETLSYWTNLKRISLDCAFSGKLDHISNLSNTLLFLGSIEQENDKDGLGVQDYHKVLNFLNEHDMSGIDVHANILMSLLHLDSSTSTGLPQLQQLSWVKSVLLVFFGVLFINLAVTKLLSGFNIQNEIFTYLFAALISTTIFFAISIILLLSSQPVWFNWIIGMVLFNTIEWILLARRKLPLMLSLSFLYLAKKLKGIFSKQPQNTEGQ